MNENLQKLLQKNEKAMELLRDEKVIDTLKTVKEMFLEKFLERGDIRILILDSISEKPRHGYQIIMSISERFNGFYKPSPGAVYPTLQALSEEGLAKCEANGIKKVYNITPKGEKFLKQNRKRADEILTAFREILLGQNDQYMRGIEKLYDIWPQFAFTIFFNLRESLKKADPNTDKKLEKTRKLLQRSVKEMNAIWSHDG
ncbi:MAG: PadR family transcriptional regulator [Candidatus Altiarchaeota archaeon]|nr:PadR family transcriptional regulator [Candidatus Altiarchaeota archaeon]